LSTTRSKASAFWNFDEQHERSFYQCFSNLSSAARADGPLRATTIFLRLPQDCTNALRLYRLDRIPADFFETVQSSSYSFFLESLHRLHLSGFRIREIAIKLPPRTYGHSKMRQKDIVYSALLILRLGWSTRFGRIRPIPLAGCNTGEPT
jgi:hypothetical protein